jgi:hypothetical protein
MIMVGALIAQAPLAPALPAAARSRAAAQVVRESPRLAEQSLLPPGQQRFPSAAKLGLEAMPAQGLGPLRL